MTGGPPAARLLPHLTAGPAGLLLAADTVAAHRLRCGRAAAAAALDSIWRRAASSGTCGPADAGRWPVQPSPGEAAQLVTVLQLAAATTAGPTGDLASLIQSDESQSVLAALRTAAADSMCSSGATEEIDRAITE